MPEFFVTYSIEEFVGPDLTDTATRTLYECILSAANKAEATKKAEALRVTFVDMAPDMGPSIEDEESVLVDVEPLDEYLDSLRESYSITVREFLENKED